VTKANIFSSSGLEISNALIYLITATDQLEKSREIIKRLKDDRKRLIDEYEEKLRGREDQMETEKEKLVQEISRGKSAAITLMQVRVFVLFYLLVPKKKKKDPLTSSE
jgi:hypothetical protein